MGEARRSEEGDAASRAAHAKQPQHGAPAVRWSFLRKAQARRDASAAAAHRAHLRAAELGWKALAIAAAALAVAAVAFVLVSRGCATKQPVEVEQEAASQSVASEPVQETCFQVAQADFESIPAVADIQTFSLAGDIRPQLSPENFLALQEAVAAMADLAEFGFVLVDVDTGAGVACNLDAEIYGASSLKAPFATFVCEQLIDTGLLSLDDQCPAELLIDYDSPFAFADEPSYAVRDLLASCITESDNNAFLFLRDAYTDLGWDNWLLSLGTDKMEVSEDYPFSWFTPRDLIEAWAETYTYLQEDTEASQLLSEWLAGTSASFLRESLASTGAVVKSKAGWVEASWAGTGSLCDAGIIQLDGKTYIMSIMTSLGDSDFGRSSLKALVSVLFSVRGDL